MRERELHRRLRDAPVPGVDEARQRGWRVVRAAYAERPPTATSTSTSLRLALALAAAAAILAVALTPAGATVVDFVGDAVTPGARHAEPALTHLPGGGSLLVQSASGPWVVNADGSKRFLGNYEEAGWSAGGQFVAVAAGHELKAVEPTATDAVHWTVSSGQPVSHPSWSTSGVRVAYLSGSSLRVVRGDGIDDHLLAKHVARVTPEWRPQATPLPANFQAYGPRTNVLGYVTSGGRVVVQDTDSGKVLLQSPTETHVDGLLWSADGRFLSSFSRRGLLTYDMADPGATPLADGMPPRLSLEAAVFAPHGDSVAAITTRQGRSGPQSSLIVSRPGADAFAANRVFSGPGTFSDLAWSPDGEWLLLGWTDADQWLFLDPETGRVNPVDDIGAQFEAGATSPTAPPHVAGWCCTAFGTNSP